MPYPNHHACRKVEPSSCMTDDDNWGQQERVHEGKKYLVVRGRLKSTGEWVDQAFRYPKEVWDVDTARNHCKSHDGIVFEPASEEESKQMELERMSVRCEWQLTESKEKKPVLEGYAALFDVPVNMGHFMQQVAHGAFTSSLKDANSDVRATFNHDPNHVLGRRKAGTLQLKEDEKGLRVRITPPDTQFSRDLQESIRRGDIDQMSFAWFTMKDMWEHKDENEPDLRTIIEASLDDGDVAVVTYPACANTSVALCSMERWRKEREAAENPPRMEREQMRMALRLRGAG